MLEKWRELEITDSQKTRNQGYDHCRRRRYLSITPITSQTVTLKPKTQPLVCRTLPASFPLVDAWMRKQLGLERFSPESQDAVALQQIKERGALPMIDRGDESVRQSTVAAISGLHCRALVMVSSSIRLDSLIAKIQRSGRNGQRDWCMSRVTAIISALVICIIVCLSWAVNHYRDNAITYKAQRDKNARELKLENAAITDMQMSAWCCCARCKNTRRYDAKAKMMLCVMMCRYVVGCTSKQSVVSAWSHHRLRRG